MAVNQLPQGMRGAMHVYLTCDQGHTMEIVIGGTKQLPIFDEEKFGDGIDADVLFGNVKAFMPELERLIDKMADDGMTNVRLMTDDEITDFRKQKQDDEERQAKAMEGAGVRAREVRLRPKRATSSGAVLGGPTPGGTAVPTSSSEDDDGAADAAGDPILDEAEGSATLELSEEEAKRQEEAKAALAKRMRAMGRSGLNALGGYSMR